MVITPAQCRAARAILGWSSQQLAERAGVSRTSVMFLEDERPERHSTVTIGIATKVMDALKKAGIIFVWPDAREGEGVRRALSALRGASEDDGEEPGGG